MSCYKFFINNRVIINLSRNGANISMFAPYMEQHHVIDHHSGVVDESQKRLACNLYAYYCLMSINILVLKRYIFLDQTDHFNSKL